MLKLAQPQGTQGLWMSADGERESLSAVDDEQRLVLIAMAIGRFFARYEDTVLHTDDSLPCWLRSQHFKNPYKAPFELPGRNATCERYRTACKKMTFVYRPAHLVRMQDAVGPASGVPFSKHALGAIEALWNSVSGRVYAPSDQAGATTEDVEYHFRLLGGCVQALDDDTDMDDDNLDESFVLSSARNLFTTVDRLQHSLSTSPACSGSHATG
jgi:hypothetical protein